MEKQRRRELIREAKAVPRELGILSVKRESDGKCYLEACVNLPGKLNSTRFQLANGSHRNRDLQRDFTETEGKGFSVEAIDSIMAKDEDKDRDFSEELEIMLMLAREKQVKEGRELY